MAEAGALKEELEEMGGRVGESERKAEARNEAIERAMGILREDIAAAGGTAGGEAAAAAAGGTAVGGAAAAAAGGADSRETTGAADVAAQLEAHGTALRAEMSGLREELTTTQAAIEALDERLSGGQFFENVEMKRFFNRKCRFFP